MNRIITLCGSTKFKNEIFEIQKKLTLQGDIVLPIIIFEETNVITNDTKKMLDSIHRRKIDMSDGIYVIDVNEYIGENTKSEIEYAKAHGKTIEYYSHPDMIVDAIGGVHDEGLGWNPNGIFCGECSWLSCEKCPCIDSK